MTTQTLPRRNGILPKRWIVGGVALVVVLIVAVLALNGRIGASQSAATGPATVAVTRGDIVARVAGSGAVAAEQTLDLPFQTAGSVKEVLVKAGDTVVAGQPLAKIDDRTLQLQVSTDEANLRNAQLKLDQAKTGAKDTDLTSAQAKLDAAVSSYNALNAAPRAADVQDAQARVASAQAQLNKAKSGPTEQDLANGRQSVESAKNALWGAQGNRDAICGRAKNPDQDSACTQARASVNQQEAQVQIAQNNLDKLLTGPDANDVTVAEQSVRQAQAGLQKLQQGPTQDQLAQAQASITQAQAGLDALKAGPDSVNVQMAETGVAQAQTKLQQSQLALENATLTAPFAGVVTAVNIVPGSNVNSATPAVKLIDRSVLHIDLKLSENDVARVQVGQPVELTVDSLNGWKAQGTVSYVAPAAETTNGVVTYAVRVSFPDPQAQVKVGMTANISIITAQKQGVLLAPNTALLPKGAGRAVQVVDAEGKTNEVDVVTGLSDGTQTEIVSGVSENAHIVALPVTAAPQRHGMFGG